MSGRDLAGLRYRFVALGLLGVAAVVTFVLGAATAAPGPLQYSNQGATTTDYTPLFIGLGLVAIVGVVVGLLLFMRHRRARSPPEGGEAAPAGAQAGGPYYPSYQSPPGDEQAAGQQSPSSPDAAGGSP